MKAIKLRIYDKYNQEWRCKFGCKEQDCKYWYQFQSEHIKFLNERCDLNVRYKVTYDDTGYLRKIYLCPKLQKQYLDGCKPKKFKVDSTIYRKIASSSMYLIKESNYKTVFFTLTFPKFKKQINEKELNQYFSRFMENLRTNYSCMGYIAAREGNGTTLRYHYHVLCSIPFVPFSLLNNIWCNTIQDICIHSLCALRTDPKTSIIKNPVKAIKYICKYFTKCRGQRSDTRIVFISNKFLNVNTGEVSSLIQKPKQIIVNVTDYLKKYKGIYINQTSDYSTCFRITDSKSFSLFLNEKVFPLFGIGNEKTDLLLNDS